MLRFYRATVSVPVYDVAETIQALQEQASVELVVTIEAKDLTDASKRLAGSLSIVDPDWSRSNLMWWRSRLRALRGKTAQEAADRWAN